MNGIQKQIRSFPVEVVVVAGEVVQVVGSPHACGREEEEMDVTPAGAFSFSRLMPATACHFHATPLSFPPSMPCRCHCSLLPFSRCLPNTLRFHCHAATHATPLSPRCVFLLLFTPHKPLPFSVTPLFSATHTPRHATMSPLTIFITPLIFIYLLSFTTPANHH